MHLDREHAVTLVAGQFGDFAVIDRLDEAGLDQAALEEGAAPFFDREVHHIGHDVDAGHQPAGKSEAARHGVVVDLVFGQF